MDIGNVLSEAWDLYKRFLWQFFLTALVVFAVLDLLSALAGEAAGDGAAAGVFWGLIAFVIGIASALIRLVFSPLPSFLDNWLGSLVAHSLTVPFAAAALTTVYFKLTAPATTAVAPDAEAEAPPAV